PSPTSDKGSHSRGIVVVDYWRSETTPLRACAEPSRWRGAKPLARSQAAGAEANRWRGGDRWRGAKPLARSQAAGAEANRWRGGDRWRGAKPLARSQAAGAEANRWRGAKPLARRRTAARGSEDSTPWRSRDSPLARGDTTLYLRWGPHWGNQFMWA